MTFRTDPELYEAMRRAAKAEDRSLSNWIERAARQALEAE